MASCLLIDDNEVNLLVAQRMLEKLGLSTHTAKSAEEARPLITTLEPDALLLDWHMPGMSGIDFLKELRANENGRHMAIFLYSGVEDQRGIQAALSAGADGYIPKPISLEKLQKEFKKIRLL